MLPVLLTVKLNLSQVGMVLVKSVPIETPLIYKTNEFKIYPKAIFFLPEVNTELSIEPTNEP